MAVTKRRKGAAFPVVSAAARLIAGVSFTAALALSGCGETEHQRKELNIVEHTSLMEKWKDELPADGMAEVASASVRGLSLERGEEEIFTVAYEPGEYKPSYDYWELDAPYSSMTTVNTETLYELFGQIDGLALTPDTSGKTAEESGVADSDRSVAIALDSTGDETPETVLRFTVGDSDNKGNYYVQAEGSEQISLVPSGAVDVLFEVEPYDYILKLPVLVDITSVSDVEVEKDGKLYTMSAGDGEYRINGRKAEEEEYNTAYQKLMGVFLAGEIPDGEQDKEQSERKSQRQGKESSSGDEILTIRFFRNTADASDVEVIYSTYDDRYASVSVNGESYFLAEMEEVEALYELSAR